MFIFYWQIYIIWGDYKGGIINNVLIAENQALSISIPRRILSFKMLDVELKMQ